MFSANLAEQHFDACDLYYCRFFKFIENHSHSSRESSAYSRSSQSQPERRHSISTFSLVNSFRKIDWPRRHSNASAIRGNIDLHRQETTKTLVECAEGINDRGEVTRKLDNCDSISVLMENINECDESTLVAEKTTSDSESLDSDIMDSLIQSNLFKIEL